ncbi:MAG: DUF3502 domain-containing protein [Lachnospiraceae bacterium]
MKRKKLISLLVLTMAVTLSACQRVSPGEAEDTIGDVRQEMTSDAAQKDTMRDEDEDSLVWRIASPGTSEEEMDVLIGNWQGTLNNLLERKGAGYSVRMEAFGCTDDAVEQAVQTADELEELFMSGEQTDVISILPPMQYEDLKGYQLAYQECAERNLLMPLDSLLDTEKGKVLCDAIPARDLERAKVHGVTYGLSAVLPTIQAVVYSQEQMEQHGIDAKELTGSIFTKEDVLQKIRERTGEAPYGIRTGDVKRKLGLWIVDPSCNLALDGEGKFVNITETREFREYLTKLADWKEKGLVEVIGSSKGAEMFFVQDMGEENYSDQPYQATLGVTLRDGTEKTASVLVVPDETSPVLSPYWGDNKLCIASWTQQQEKAEDFLIRLMTDPEIANLIQYGREGDGYTLNGNILEIASGANVFQRFFGYQYTNPLITYSTAVMAQDKQAYAERFHEACEKAIPDGFRFDPAPVAEQIVRTNGVFGDMGGSETAGKIANLEIEDVDQVIAEITGELKEAGMDEVVAEANRQLEEWKKEAGK